MLKKFLIKSCFLFLPILLSIYVISKFDNVKYDVNESIARVKTAKYLTTKDYLFVGSSYTYNGIDITQFDSIQKSAYILGVATAGPYFYEILIDDYLQNCKTVPHTLFININLATCSSIMDNWASYPIHRYLNKPLSNEYVGYKYTTINDYFLLIRKSFKKSIANLFMKKKEINFSSKENEILINKGFSSPETIFNDSLLKDTKAIYNRYSKTEFNAEKAKFLISLIHKYEQKGLQVILFETPTFKLETFFSKEYILSYNNFKNSLIVNKICFIKDNGNINTNYFFASIDHMNKNGAKVFTKQLINHLKEIKN